MPKRKVLNERMRGVHVCNHINLPMLKGAPNSTGTSGNADATGLLQLWQNQPLSHGTGNCCSSVEVPLPATLPQQSKCSFTCITDLQWCCC
jgi:hypothetical protein